MNNPLLETLPKNQYCDEDEAADAASKEEREYRDIEINSNGVFLVGHVCGACGGRMMIGGSRHKIDSWCSRCNRLATDTSELQVWWNNVTKKEG